MEGFFLGLSNGGTCLAYCAPFLIPYFMGGGNRVGQNFFAAARFLLGRLLAYLLFGLFAWGIHKSLLQSSGHHPFIIGGAYLLFSTLLIQYSLFRNKASCPVQQAHGFFDRNRIEPSFLPLVAGFATGLSFCPPVLLAFTSAAGQGSLLQSLFFFSAFFTGTAVFLIPAPFIGALRGFPSLRLIGRMAAGVVGLYYFYAGLFQFIGGVKSI